MRFTLSMMLLLLFLKPGVTFADQQLDRMEQKLDHIIQLVENMGNAKLFTCKAICENQAFGRSDSLSVQANAVQDGILDLHRRCDALAELYILVDGQKIVLRPKNGSTSTIKFDERACRRNNL